MNERADLPEFIDTLVRVGAEQLVSQLAVPQDRAGEVMRAVAEQVCSAYSRRFIYVPVAYDPRNREIVDKYHRQGRTARACTGARVRELATEYGLTERRIYEIVREAREADLAERQGVLPGLEEA